MTHTIDPDVLASCEKLIARAKEGVHSAFSQIGPFSVEGHTITRPYFKAYHPHQGDFLPGHHAVASFSKEGNLIDVNELVATGGYYEGHLAEWGKAILHLLKAT